MVKRGGWEISVTLLTIKNMLKNKILRVMRANVDLIVLTWNTVFTGCFRLKQTTKE